MATQDQDQQQYHPSDRFGWGSTSEIRMLDSDGNPLSAEDVAAVNEVLAYRAWAAANPEEAAADAEAEGEDS